MRTGVERIRPDKISGGAGGTVAGPGRQKRMRRALLSLPAVAAVLLLSGCGDPDPHRARRWRRCPEHGRAELPAHARPPPIPPPRPTKPVDPTASGRPITVDGVVETGVEPGCKVLTADGKLYQVLGDDVPVGVPVRVTGVLQPGVLTTCQQGTPMRVTKVQRR